MAKIIHSVWFSNWKGTIGIVVTEGGVPGSRRAYIGVVDGKDERVNAQSVAFYGSKLTLRVARELVGILEKK